VPRLDDVLNRAADAARSVTAPDVVFHEVERRLHVARRRRRSATIAISFVVAAISVGSVFWAAGVFESDAKPVPDRIIPADLGEHVPAANGRLIFADGETLNWVDPVDGSTEPYHLPADVAGDVWGATFSPDGTRLALQVFGTKERSVWVVDLATGNAVQIAAADNVSTPSWSPNGRFLVYGVEEGRRSSIRIASSDGLSERQVGESAPEGTTYFSPAISPDGTRIAYKKHIAPAEAESHSHAIETVAPDGTDRRTLVYYKG
jgi:dipeptidyl aminopeptidase/acylaminoacyl peptidase